MNPDKISDLVRTIIDNLAEKDFDIEISNKNNEFVFNVNVDGSDMGRVIGKGGRTANSMRDIIKSLTAGEKSKYYLKINKKQ